MVGIVFTIFFTFPITLLAEEGYLSEIDRIYLNAYNEAVTLEFEYVNTEETSYAYLLQNRESVYLESNGTLTLVESELELSGDEKIILLNFVEKVNKLVNLQAIWITEELIFVNVTNPQSIRPRLVVMDILTECRNHAAELKEVHDNAVLGTRDIVAGTYFMERVKSGGIWDYKYFLGRTTRYMIEDLGGVSMTGENIGNFHYGYVGRAVFSATLLKSAAGMYQIYSGTSSIEFWDSYFDDPEDMEDIQWGINTYNSEH